MANWHNAPSGDPLRGENTTCFQLYLLIIWIDLEIWLRSYGCLKHEGHYKDEAKLYICYINIRALSFFCKLNCIVYKLKKNTMSSIVIANSVKCYQIWIV